MDNFRLSEHLAAVQKLLEHCRVPSQSEKTTEDDNRRGWYPVWKRPFVQPSILHLLYQPLKEASNIDDNVHAEQVPSEVQWGMKLRRIIFAGGYRRLSAFEYPCICYLFFVVVIKAEPKSLHFTNPVSDFVAGMGLMN